MYPWIKISSYPLLPVTKPCLRNFLLLLLMVFSLLFLQPLLQAEEAEAPQFSLTSRLIMQDSFSSRVQGEWKGVLLSGFALDKNQERSLWMNLGTPWFSLGRLNSFGLIHELENPWGSGLESALYTETTRFALDNSLEGSPSRGEAVHLWSHSFGLFHYQNKAELYGGTLCLGLNESLSLELLGATGIYPGEEGTEQWFYDFPQFLGGEIRHLAARFQVKWPQLLLSLAGAASLGIPLYNGWYGRIWSTYRTSWLNLWFLIQAKNPYFVELGNKQTGDGIKTGLGTALSPIPWWVLKLQWLRETGRNTAADQDHTREDELSVRCGVEANKQYGAALYGQWEQQQNLKGIEYQAHQLGLSGWFASESSRYQTETGIIWEDGQVPALFLELDTRISTEPLDFLFSLDLLKGAWIRLKGMAAVSWKRESAVVYVKGGLQKYWTVTPEGGDKILENPWRFLSFTIGWKTAIIRPQTEP